MERTLRHLGLHARGYGAQRQAGRSRQNRRRNRRRDRDVVSEEDKAAAQGITGKYMQCYKAFGAEFKEGMGEDFANKDRLARTFCRVSGC